MDTRLQMILDANRDGLLELSTGVLRLSKRLETIDGLRRQALSERGVTRTDSPVSQAMNNAVAELVQGDGDVNVESVAGSLLEARRREELAQAFVDVLERARGILEQKVTAAVSDGADDLIAGSMQPALEALFRGVRRNAKALEGVELSPDVVLAAGDSRQRNAYLALRATHQTYGRLRTSYAALVQLRRRKSADGDGYFATFEYPEKWSGAPTDEVARIVALATTDAHAWMPTADEQDTRLARWQVEIGPQRREEAARLRSHVRRAEAIEVGGE